MFLALAVRLILVILPAFLDEISSAIARHTLERKI
jgi:hypothetical protein